MTKASTTSSSSLVKRVSHPAALDKCPRPCAVGARNNQVKPELCKTTQQSTTKQKNEIENINILSEIKIEDELKSSLKINTDADDICDRLNKIHLASNKENLAPEESNNITKVEPKTEESSKTDNACEDELCSRGPGRHIWRTEKRHDSVPYNVSICSRNHHSGSSLVVSDLNDVFTPFNISNEEVERDFSPPLLQVASPNGSISDEEMADVLSSPDFNKNFAKILADFFKTGQLSPEMSELSTSPLGSPYASSQGSPQQVVPYWQGGTSDSTCSSPGRVSTTSLYATPSLSPGSPNCTKLDDFHLDKELPSSPPQQYDIEPPLGLELETMIPIDNYSNQYSSIPSILQTNDTEPQLDTLLEDISELNAMVSMTENQLNNNTVGLQNVPVPSTMVPNSTGAQNISWGNSMDYNTAGLPNLSLLNINALTTENVPLPTNLISNPTNQSPPITYIVLPINDSMRTAPQAKLQMRHRPILPLPETAKDKLIKKLDRSKKREAWVRVALVSDADLIKGEAKDGDTQMMILVGQLREMLLELVYAMVERLKRIPGALEKVNKRGQSALYVACISLPLEPIVPCYIAETLANMGVDVSKLTYEGGKTLTQCICERGSSHASVLTELLNLKDSAGKLIFSN